MIKDLRVGKIVCYTTDNNFKLPAIIVNIFDFDNGICNLQVFTDCKNSADKTLSYEEKMKNVIWRTSVNYNGQGIPNTWNFFDEPKQTVRETAVKKDISIETAVKGE
jgi:hypothetical protein